MPAKADYIAYVDKIFDDPEGIIAELKTRVTHIEDALKHTTIALKLKQLRYDPFSLKFRGFNSQNQQVMVDYYDFCRALRVRLGATTDIHTAIDSTLDPDIWDVPIQPRLMPIEIFQASTKLKSELTAPAGEDD